MCAEAPQAAPELKPSWVSTSFLDAQPGQLSELVRNRVHRLWGLGFLAALGLNSALCCQGALKPELRILNDFQIPGRAWAGDSMELPQELTPFHVLQVTS